VRGGEKQKRFSGTRLQRLKTISMELHGRTRRIWRKGWQWEKAIRDGLLRKNPRLRGDLKEESAVVGRGKKAQGV